MNALESALAETLCRMAGDSKEAVPYFVAEANAVLETLRDPALRAEVIAHIGGTQVGWLGEYKPGDLEVWNMRQGMDGDRPVFVFPEDGGQ